MLNFFKKLLGISAKTARPTAKRKPRKSASRPEDFHSSFDPIPVAEVREGNDHKDWGLWEDSVSVIDSQMQPPSAREKQRQQDLQTKPVDEDKMARAFESVRPKKR
jgi:hypothetical protein